MTQVDPHEFTQVRDGMRITWQAPILLRDGITLRADVFRPLDESLRLPVIISHGVYAKGLSYQEGYPLQWNKMVQDHPDILEGSTNQYQNWEVTDPERWVPHGYVVVRVDSRGSGWSEGVLDPMTPLETEDFCQSIEWAASRPWCNGVVGVLGISYYANMAWRVAERQPRGLKAIIPWEGFIDMYRDPSYHGGILNEFPKKWAAIQAVTVQYGLGSRARKHPLTGQSIAGPVDLDDEQLARNRRDMYEQMLDQPLDNAWWRGRSPDPTRITIPFLSAANWGGMGIHPRGNFSGFTDSPAPQKWLEVHGDTHWSLFSAGYGLDLQKRFFDHFCLGAVGGAGHVRRQHEGVVRQQHRVEDEEWLVAVAADEIQNSIVDEVRSEDAVLDRFAHAVAPQRRPPVARTDVFVVDLPGEVLVEAGCRRAGAYQSAVQAPA